MSSKVAIVFAPGVLEEMAEFLSPEEQQALMDEITATVNSPDFILSSDTVDISELEPDMADYVQSVLAADKSTSHTLH